MTLWVIGTLAVIGIVAAVALQVAIARDGPAVLSAVDRLTGETAHATRKAVVSTGEHPQQQLVVWAPSGASESETKLPVLVFIHGGSWKSGDPTSYDFVGRAFTERGFVVVLGGYRLGEDGKYPAMIEDTASVIGWTHREIANHGGDPARIVIAGHSAGAYNVVMAALEEKWLSAEGVSAEVIAGTVGLSGPYDFFPFDSEASQDAFGHADEPTATQPVSHVRGDAPPKLLIHGEKDTLVKVRNTRELASRIEKSGGAVTTRYYPEMEHNDPLISLAAPWRSRRDVADTIAQFAHNAASSGRVSVPVQDETR